MLQNEYLVAKIGVDTAENEPRKDTRWIRVCPVEVSRRQPLAPQPVAAPRTGGPRVQGACRHRHDTSLFPRLVLGCINADFGHQIFIFQHFSRSTRFAYFCITRNSIFKRKLFQLFFNRKFLKVLDNILQKLSSERCKSVQIL